MKLGVLTALFSDKPLKEVLDLIRPLKLQTVELGTGNYPGEPHCPLQELLESKPKRDELLATLKGEGLEISALSCHGNPIHPDEAFAKANHAVTMDTIKLANLLGVGVVNGFSGCPGSGPGDKKPNWVTCAWPPDYLEILDWQWNEVVLPYWSKMNTELGNAGVKFAFEMHPGFVVYNTDTMLRVRRECGDNIGANFDPSHLFWQGMEPVECVKALKGCIYHVHAKDSIVHQTNAAVNGVNDYKSYGDEINRSWIFRTCGYGHDLKWWNDFFSTLRMVGYDGAISIEHEDSLMSNWEGLTKAVSFLKKSIIFEAPTAMTWA